MVIKIKLEFDILGFGKEHYFKDPSAELVVMFYNELVNKLESKIIDMKR